jgi:hypothetical protein
MKLAPDGAMRLRSVAKSPRPVVRDARRASDQPRSPRPGGVPVVVCGCGRFGRVVADELKRDWRTVVLIEREPDHKAELVRADLLYNIVTLVLPGRNDEVSLEELTIASASRLAGQTIAQIEESNSRLRIVGLKRGAEALTLVPRQRDAGSANRPDRRSRRAAESRAPRQSRRIVTRMRAHLRFDS